MIVARGCTEQEVVSRKLDGIVGGIDDLDVRRRIRDHVDLERRRHIGNGSALAAREPHPAACVRRVHAAGEVVPVGLEAKRIPRTHERNGVEHRARATADDERRPPRYAHRLSRRHRFGRAPKIRRIDRANRDITDERAIGDAHDHGVRLRASIAGDERDIGIERPKGDGCRAVAHVERALAPRRARRASVEGDRAPRGREDAQPQRVAAHHLARRVYDAKRRDECTGPRAHRMPHRAPPVRRVAPRAPEQHEREYRRHDRTGAGYHRASKHRGRQRARMRRERRAERTRRAFAERTLMLDLDRTAQRPVAQRALPLDRVRDLRWRRRAPHARDRPHQRYADRGHHDHPRDSGGCRLADPARVAEPERSEPREQSGRGERERRTTRAHRRHELEALARNELSQRHESGRLVTAYTKRFTPMRSAASCSAGGS